MSRTAWPVSLALVAVLSSCGGPVQVAAVSSDAVAVAPVARYSTVESAVRTDGLGAQNYVDTVRGLLSGVPHVEQPDADLIQGGKDMCAEIDAGATWTTFSRQVDEIGGDHAFYRAVVRAAVLSFCIDDVAALSR